MIKIKGSGDDNEVIIVDSRDEERISFKIE